MPPNPNSVSTKIGNVAVDYLVTHHKHELSSRFYWKNAVITGIKSAYENKHGKISVEDMKIINEKLNSEGPKKYMLVRAREQCNVGIIHQGVDGGELGAVRKLTQKSSSFKATENAANGLGPLQFIDLSLEQMEKAVEMLEAIQRGETPVVPEELQRYYLKGAKESEVKDRVCAMFDGVQTLVKDAFGNNINMSAEEVLMSKEHNDARVDAMMKDAKVREGCKNEELARMQGGGIRKFSISALNDILTGEIKVLLEGKAIMLPVKYTLTSGKILQFDTLATMVSNSLLISISYLLFCAPMFSPHSHYQYLTNDQGILKNGKVILDRLICPGMSANHYGDQAKNNQPLHVSKYILSMPGVGEYFNTDVKKDPRSRSDYKSDKARTFAPITITVSGKRRMMSRIKLSSRDIGMSIIYKHFSLILPGKRTPTSKSTAAASSSESDDVESTAAASSSESDDVESDEESEEMEPTKTKMPRLQITLGTRKHPLKSSAAASSSESESDDVESDEESEEMETSKVPTSSSEDDAESDVESVYEESDYEESDYEESDYEEVETSKKRKPPVQLTSTATATKKKKTDTASQNSASDQPPRRTISHHRFGALITTHLGVFGNNPELIRFLKEKKVTSLEALHLVTGETQIDRNQLVRNLGLDEDVVATWEEMEIEEENVPQGQCDFDHFFHRSVPICNSHYIGFGVSHTANICNSIIRRSNGDWCYGLSVEEYVDGR